MHFKDYFSFEDFRQLADIYNQADAPHGVYEEFRKATFDSNLMSFLKDLNKKSPLAKISNSEGHVSWMQEAWDSFIKGENKAHYLRDIPDMFFRVVSRSLSDTFNIESKTLKQRYEELTNKMNDGNIEHHEMDSSPSCDCQNCDQKMKLTFQKWKPRYNIFSYSNGEIIEKLPETCLPNVINELPFTFKTGNLLIADWFRIDEFTDATKEKDYRKYISINSAKGRVEQITKYLEDFNFISVNIGSCDPSVLQNPEDGSLTFGYFDKDEIKESENKLINKGRVTTDLWATTIIEKETLIEIISKYTGEEATQLVEDYLEEESDVIKLQIEPGEYILRFHGNYERFQELATDEDFPSGVEPYFMIKKALL